MANQKEESLFIKHYRIIVIPIVFLLYLFSHFLLNPYDVHWYASVNEQELLETLILLLLYCTVITEVSLWLSRVLNNWIPWDRWAGLRAIVQLISLIVIIFIVYFLLNLLYLVCMPLPANATFSLDLKIDLWQSLIISINTGIFISAVHTGYFLIKNWRTSMMDAAELRIKTEKLERIASQAELESLKMQLDPHFLFNNFSTLSELVIEDQNLAAKFLEHLSLVYRYMLSNVRKNVVSLEEELSFVDSYFYLIKERMGSKVILKVDISDKVAEQFYIAPIALQLLVENAVKHNKASKEIPLIIEIFIQDNGVVVRNNIRELAAILPSPKVGLQNIIDRYRLLSEINVVIQKDADYFSVWLPLLDNAIKKDKSTLE
ncbi:sensor histidine kinase [Myroides sp. LJL115]